MNSVRKGDANRVYVRDEWRHPGQEVPEVQQNVEGNGDHPNDDYHDRLVERLLYPTQLGGHPPSLVS
jgi:hypothetical protein